MMSKGPLEKRERLHRLCKNIVDNPHDVDDSTRAALRTAALKYAHTQYDDPTQVLKGLYHDEGELGFLLRKAVAIVDEADDASDETDVTKAHEHRGHSQLAGALVQHLHDALERRRDRHGYTKAHTATKDHTMNRTEELRSIAKDYGVVRLAKLLVADGDSHGIGESELVELIGNHDRRDGETAAKCFVRQYEANTEDGLALRKAVSIAKSATFDAFSVAPVFVGGEDTRDLSDESEAIAQLKELGARKWPNASALEQFERALTAPENRELQKRAYRRPQANAANSFPFPR
jgi:hypothetical protein